MPKSITALALERLGFILNSGSVEQLKQSLNEFEQVGLQKEKLINFPIQRYNGRTAVHLASNNGMYDCLELLLKSGGNPNVVSSPTDLSQTPLHVASSKGYRRCIQVLLDNGARMDIKNTHRETAYDLVKGKVTCERVFQHAIAKYKIPQRTIEQQKRVEALHDIVGIEESLDDFYRYYEQLPPEHKDLATRWTDFFQQTLLYRATNSELVEVVKFMLSKSSSQPLHNLDTSETALLLACRKSHHEIGELLLEHSPRLIFVSEARSNLSPLHVACSKGDIRMVRLLLGTIKRYTRSEGHDNETEISLDFRDELGRTPLYNACYYGYYDVVKLMVDFYRDNSMYVSLNINAAVKNSQRTPLHVAVRKGSLEVVQLLLSMENIEVNLEARPSGRTQGKMISICQKSMHGRGFSVGGLGRYDSIEEEMSFNSTTIKAGVRKKSGDDTSPVFTPDLPTSPLGTRTPELTSTTATTSSSLSSSSSTGTLKSTSSTTGLHIDDSVGIGVAPVPSTVKQNFRNTGALPHKTGGIRSYSTLPPKRASRTNSSDSATTPVEEDVTLSDFTPKGKKRSQTDAEGLDEGESNLRVYEDTKTKKLQFQMKDSNSTQNGKDFGQIFMTPLAEACACGHTKIMKLLLVHGARDDSGLACRIAFLMQRYYLIGRILSYHTLLKDNLPVLEEEDIEDSDMCYYNLELHWSFMKLPVAKGEWFGPSAEFHPLSKDRDREFEDTGYTSSSGEMGVSFKSTAPPMAKIHCDAIRSVHLDNNNLHSIPLELFQLCNVIKINLNNNKIAALPTATTTQEQSGGSDGDYSSEVHPGQSQPPPPPVAGADEWKCPSLTELIMNKNELTHIPAIVWKLPRLTKFSVSRNKLVDLLPDEGDSITDEDIQFSGLETVDLSGNTLKGTIPRFIFELPGLKVLNLSGNMICQLPETLWGCDTLQDLNLAENKLEMLPWCEPERVYRDSFSSASYSTPPSIQQANKVLLGKVTVKAHFVDRNKSMYNKAPSTIRALNVAQEVSGGDAIVSCDYSSLLKLNISSNRFSIFPEALPCFAPKLTDFDISRNPLHELDIQFLPASLRKLSAKACKITRFGNVITRSLHTQVIRNCRHGGSVGQACQHRSHSHLLFLATIDISSNKLSYMQLIRSQPTENELQDFGKLETEYDSKIGALDLLYPALEGLNLIGNQLKGKFNPNIGRQTHLKWIRLSNNPDLTGIPMEFAHLKNTKQLTELGMDQLPNLVEPPVEYQNVSLSHLLTYMRSRLKESDYHRSIKLFFIGNGERGKTTLLSRLRGFAEDKKVERTAGIDIKSWVYPDPRKFSLREKKKPINFLAWDFAGQEVYHTTHQCFYSKRSMYLALFRLIDGEEGIEELEQWLRNVQLRAPGCPVVIVGTHLDALPDQSKAKALEAIAMKKYSNSPNYPKIVSVVSISCVRRLFGNQMEHLRNLLHSVASHLSLGKDGISLEYRPDMSETDPKALFQQQVPQTFLSLQDRLQEKVAELRQEDKVPIMDDSVFRAAFKDLFEDEDELLEAIYFLNLQGTLLHFEDLNLRNVYFLDPEWLAKLMADVIHPAALGKADHIVNGVAEISGLFCQRDITPVMKDRYISLMEKFEVALKINPQQMIIPSLMPESATYPKPNDILSDISSSMLDDIEGHYQPPLRRIWLADYIPAGFWPRLICRVATDHQIGRVFRTILGSATPSSSNSVDSNMSTIGGESSGGGGSPIGGSNFSRSPSIDKSMEQSVGGEGNREILNWTPWKTGMAFSFRGRTLLVLKQADNQPSEDFLETWQIKLRLLRSKYRIEVHIYTNEWVALANEIMELSSSTLSFVDFDCLPGLATKLLVMITTHIKALALSWFPGMLISQYNNPFITYVPCWKCYGEIGSPRSLHGDGVMKGDFISKDSNPITTFILDQHIITAALDRPLECCIHGNIKIMHMAPDLIFWDLLSDVSYQDSNSPLRVCEDEVLGKGGFGFVCKGELTTNSGSNTGNLSKKKNVAVKIFLEDVSSLLESTSITELLEISKEPKHLLYAYKEIRQEVSFLSNLNHPNLTQLCGVRTSPYMCLILELAPRKSLRAILKEYRDSQVCLESLTLKNTALQIAQGLEYLHSHQVVHLDMKSPNVLLWHFPSPRDNRQVRIRQSGNVWIKIADYGISQVSTGLTLRVDNAPVGTPGFMAPELFDRAGQVVSSEKIDVFAYGMVLYELLSQRSPFDNVQPQVKRNHEVRDGQRPTLQTRETRSLVLLQELMALCWHQDPDLRPRMGQVAEWIQAPKFERLRSEISLSEVKSISCACVCRILPEYERHDINRFGHRGRGGGGEGGRTLFDDSVDFKSMDFEKMEDLDHVGDFTSLIEEYGNGNKDNNNGLGASIDLIIPNMLPSISMESVCIENTRGDKISNDGEDIYQFLPSRHKASSLSKDRRRRTSSRRDRFKREGSLGRRGGDGGGGEDMSFTKEGGAPAEGYFDPYTQVWLCGRDQRKGLLQIFTYNDGHPGHYLFSGYCSRDEITSICPVRNMIWMGTSAGAIKIFHAPTLKTKFTCTLETEGPEGTTNRTILDILYVEELRTVLVANFSGEVWIFDDDIVADGLRMQCKLELVDSSPCYHMVKVVLNRGSKIEIWGTMENNRILIIDKPPGSSWKHTEITIQPKDPRVRLCSHIAFTSFTDSSGVEREHAWVSYRQRSILVSFNAKTREQRGILNCTEKLKTEIGQSFQITTLMCTGRKVIVGTSTGKVAVFHSETLDLMNIFSWHKEKVRTLLVMPKQVEPCICAEIPFPQQENEASSQRNSSPAGTRDGKSAATLTWKRAIKKQVTLSKLEQKKNFSSQFSYLNNKYCIMNPEPESVMITSVGNGKLGYSLSSQSKEDQLKIFNKAASGYNRTGNRQPMDDVVLLTWRS